MESQERWEGMNTHVIFFSFLGNARHVKLKPYSNYFHLLSRGDSGLYYSKGAGGQAVKVAQSKAT